MAFVPSLPLPLRPAAPAAHPRPVLAPARPAAAPSRRAALVSAPPRMLVVDAGSTADLDKILAAAEDSLVVVDYSTSWCGPCRIMAPFFVELSDRFTEVVFVKVMGDADANATELMQREGIRAVPAFHFWKNKERVKDFTGARKEDLENAVISLK